MQKKQSTVSTEKSKSSIYSAKKNTQTSTKKSKKKVRAELLPKKRVKGECILTLCAHNDDQIIGAGGTIRRYVDEGISAYTYIFSYGEASHPHLRPEVIAKRRERESLQSARILGDTIAYLELKEGTFTETCDRTELKNIIRMHNPTKIFTHTPDDPHPDHIAVYKIVTSVAKEMNFKGEIYAFDIWNLFSVKTNHYPKLFVDISKTFWVKVKALLKHKSQVNAIVSLGWHMYLKALINGWNNHCRYAELFHKINLDTIEVSNSSASVSSSLDKQSVNDSKKKKRTKQQLKNK